MTARPPLDGTALVTGSSSGIGREVAVQLAARVKTLILLARRVDRLQQLRSDLETKHPRLKVTALGVDLSDEAEVARTLARVDAEIGPVDVLVNAAGVGDSGLFDRAQWGRTRQILRTNVIATVQLTQALLPGMVARGRGGVLNIGSGAGLSVMPAAAAYTGSKHFIDGFSEALRADLAGTGVVVTQVCPGPVDSEFDDAAGSVGGMTGGPPQLLRISAEQCAREALSGFDRGDALIFPGRPYRMIMRMALPLLPRGLRRWQAAKAALRLRVSAK
jgi:short-subunit dehydrogenase